MRQVKKKLSYGKRKWPGNHRKYREQEALLGGRNSYSKTDPDATFFRMKDDHLQTGQLRPAYNFQASTNNQFITNYTLTQTAADTITLKDHIAEHMESPQTLAADAGYRSEENYTHLEEKNITGFVKYNYFDKE